MQRIFDLREMVDISKIELNYLDNLIKKIRSHFLQKNSTISDRHHFLIKWMEYFDKSYTYALDQWNACSSKFSPIFQQPTTFDEDASHTILNEIEPDLEDLQALCIRNFSRTSIAVL